VVEPIARVPVVIPVNKFALVPLKSVKRFNIPVVIPLIVFPKNLKPPIKILATLLLPILILPVVIAVATFNVPEVNAPAYDCDDVPFVPPIVKLVVFTVSIAFLKDVLIVVIDELISATDKLKEELNVVT
jgi:hypothetical protein